MTTPTQAQIEALELIDSFAWSCVKTDCEESRIELQRRISKCRAALTAAAEVGPDCQDRIIHHGRIVKEATIERCAQMVCGKAAEIEAWSHQDDASRLAAEMLRKAAAAIRAMKEQP